MMGLGPQGYIPSFKAISLVVLEKEIFEGFLPYMVMAAILVMWPNLLEYIFFHFLSPMSFQMKFGFQ